jgi:hypothetical protein
MGYTHSLLHPMPLERERFARFASDVRKLIEAVAPTVKVQGMEGEPMPTVTNEAVVFNGGCETFLVTRTLRPELGQRLRDGKLFTFTKTMHLPYDVLVVAASFALIYRFPEAKFMTDGEREALRPGFDLFISACEPELGGRDLFHEPEARQ